MLILFVKFCVVTYNRIAFSRTCLTDGVLYLYMGPAFLRAWSIPMKVIDFNTTSESNGNSIEAIEDQEWRQSLDYVLQNAGPERVASLLQMLRSHAGSQGIDFTVPITTAYCNTIPAHQQGAYPGDVAIEQRLESILRWNATAMVVRANRREEGIGGHIATYASAATLYEVAFNHFFRGKEKQKTADQIYFQGHASPGIYARAFLEGRLSENQLHNFRRELEPDGGLSSYPHPWLMSDFWEFPTVSMGLAPLMSIYQARFNRYLVDRGLKDENDSRIWAYLGDGECDEPETLGALTMAAREKLDRLTFVINCNLQRLDGPVRGNGKIMQELEGVFRGAGWHVVKVVWASEWDDLFAKDEQGVLLDRLNNIVDGELQKCVVEPGSYTRKAIFSGSPELEKIAAHLSDDELTLLRRGGHDPLKVHAAYQAAINEKSRPTVILAQTTKGYGLGENGEGRNTAHQQKKIDNAGLRYLRDRFDLPLTDKQVDDASFYRPDENSEEIQYLQEKRRALGGFVPSRRTKSFALGPPEDKALDEFADGSKDRQVSTTMAFVRLLTNLMRDKTIGKNIVPIVPDEARTFGMEGMFRQFGIYSHIGQLYDPVDSKSLMSYKEKKDGQILEEGINEAGSMASFIAAATAYSTHDVPCIPIYIYYSMFGFQRVGDFIWAAADMSSRGFLVGGTAGRTTLAGEGLQHQDGHSHVVAYSVPNLYAYDPAFAYEIAVIMKDGLRRMVENQENVFYYLTVENDNYVMPAMPKTADVETGILKGMYCYSEPSIKSKLSANLFGSGAILNEVIKAKGILEQDFDIATSVYSITSYQQLYRDGMACERWNHLHPSADQKTSYVSQCLEKTSGVYVAASDYLKLLPQSIASWVPGELVCLGTDGFGRSEGRSALRDFFEVDSKHVVCATLAALAKAGRIKANLVDKAIAKFDMNPERLNPTLR